VLFRSNELATYLIGKNLFPGSKLDVQITRDKRLNLFYKFGEPKIVFCSHLDTVPPFFKHSKKGNYIYGRGSCDAKGQIAFMYEAAKQLLNEGNWNFGLLMVSGEEDGSQGAIKANKYLKGCDYIFIGEPTENKLIKAAKGNLLASVSVKGRTSHSGYPEKGDSATESMLRFFDKLKKLKFKKDKLLGNTTYNIGSLESKNAHNVISDLVTFKVFFRTTFETDDSLKNKLKDISDKNTSIEFLYGDAPMKYFTLAGFKQDVVSYGSDAPEFTNVKNKILYGPGSILNAHTSNEHILIKDLYKAVEDIKKIFRKIISEY
jgi:acetylornithine deacetylase